MEIQKKILIIEDDIDMVEAMRVALERPDRRVISSYSPDEGLSKAKEQNPDLIILDVMFGKNGKTEGFDYAVKFKQEETLASIPILMVSAVNTEHPGFDFSTKNPNEFLPVDDFMDKPAQPDELSRKVEQLLKNGISKWANWPEKKN